MSWKPITSDELDAIIGSADFEMEPAVLEFWRLIRIRPAKWNLSPWGDIGGGFWVVGVIGNRCLWYNDIENGFNISHYEEFGRILEYGCNQIELDRCIRSFLANLIKNVGGGSS